MEIQPGNLTLSQCRTIAEEAKPLTLPDSAQKKVAAAKDVVNKAIARGDLLYGINTGFGSLMTEKVPAHELASLQERIILSHAAGVGPYLSDDIVRLILVLKINGLSQGYSGVSYDLIEALLALYHAQVYPCIPAKGSVGASGDLAPLAHVGVALLGQGNVRYNGEIIPAKEGLGIAGLRPFTFGPKEGLSLVNGTQVSTAIALRAVFVFEMVLAAALAAGALTMAGVNGNRVAFDAAIHAVRGHKGQQKIAQLFRYWWENDDKPSAASTRLQDPYSLRCQPQVMGACLTQLQQTSDTLSIEINAITDNPLVFTQPERVLSGGNFHGEPVAFAADNLALAIAETGSLSERRISWLLDHQRSGLAPFLVEDSGLNSGFMLAQVTAAALTSENKTLAYPASVDSIPTSAGQEDHVSMATHGAYRLLTMLDNLAAIVGIELLAACQAIDCNHQSHVPASLKPVYKAVREKVPFYKQDRFFAPDIDEMIKLVHTKHFITAMPSGFFS